MPKPQLPPTPASSSNLKAQGSTVSIHTTGQTFTLPPPAMSSFTLSSSTDDVATESTPASIADSTSSYHPSPPISPVQKPSHSSPRHKRTISGNPKAKSSPSSKSNTTTTTSTSTSTSPQYTLPPPPTRTRKIIQMTPKVTSQPSSMPHHSPQAKPAPASTASKRKQPSSTSAAGRKMARKTAHSIIERRRRSKMNEEFGVLKDMIPACRGQEMHKLAILQAGIEYLRYLESCVTDLRGRRYQDEPKLSPPSSLKRGRDDDEEDEDLTYGQPSPGTVKGGIRRASKVSVILSHVSPDVLPMPSSSQHSIPSQRLFHPRRSNSQASISASPSTTASTPTITPLLSTTQSYPHSGNNTFLSPAFEAIQFSPDRRISPNVAAQSFTSGTNSNHHADIYSSTSPSPNILPQAAMGPASVAELAVGFGRVGTASEERDQEATATAALMMLTHQDRRKKDGTVKSDVAHMMTTTTTDKREDQPRSTPPHSMSVKDLLGTWT